MKKYIIMIILCISLSSLAWAQAPEDRIQQLEQRIQQLEARIAQLETQLTALLPRPKPKTPDDLPADITQVIKDQAAAKFPDDNSTQLFYIKRETQAWKDLQTYTSDIPVAELSKIRQQAETRFQQDYSTQLFYINREVEAYKELHP